MGTGAAVAVRYTGRALWTSPREVDTGVMRP
jgi:hypothetical protein